jgi:hypothetical protein
MMLRRLAPAALSVALAIAAPQPPGWAAETVAARIAYEEMPRPDGLPQSFQPAATATLRFLGITAIDGNRVDAALWEPLDRRPAETTLVIAVHGSGDNFAHAPADALGRGLSAGGRAVLSISTRQHDDRVNTENFFDVRRDIEAAVMTARSLGYRRLVLSGHSLGNIQVQFYAATDWSADIQGVMLLSAFANLPWKTRNILMQDEPGYHRLNEAARAMLREGQLTERLPEPMGFYTGQRVPVTAQHFLTYRSDAASVADGTFWIRRIPKPVLIVRDAADAVIQPFEPHMLLSAAGAEGSLVQGIRFALLPNDRPPTLAAHYFPDTADKLVEAVSAWMSEKGF